MVGRALDAGVFLCNEQHRSYVRREGEEDGEKVYFLSYSRCD